MKEAREKMVTRTVTTSKVAIKRINVRADVIDTVDYEFIGTIKDVDKFIKVYAKKNDTDEYKHVAIAGIREIEKLYGMPERQFIELAKELPPRA